VSPGKHSLPTATPDLSKKVDTAGKPMLDPFGKQVDPLGFHRRNLARTRPAPRQPPRLVVELDRDDRHRPVLRPLHPGDERRGNPCPGLSRGRKPKLKNFKRAALVVFIYSLLFTSLISFFAVMIIPDDVRMSRYSDNLIGGLAMNVIGPQWARLILNGVVVIVGFLIPFRARSTRPSSGPTEC